MIKQKFDIDNLRVASPCSVGWETMSGDERRRFCEQCSLNVYNISEMTSAEVRALVEKTEGRICGRIYRRADGTVLTNDCPVGLRAYYRRTARFAGAALTAIAGLFSVGFGQSNSKNENACKKSGSIVRIQSQNIHLVEGTITDPNCAVIPDSKITLISKDTKRKIETTSDENGYYKILLLAPGRYTYRVEKEGFRSYSKSVEINKNESLQIHTKLEVGTMIGVIVCVDEKISIDPKSSSTTFRITREMMGNVPR